MIRSTKYTSASPITMRAVRSATSSSAVFVILRMISGSTISHTVVSAAQNKSAYSVPRYGLKYGRNRLISASVGYSLYPFFSFCVMFYTPLSPPVRWRSTSIRHKCYLRANCPAVCFCCLHTVPDIDLSIILHICSLLSIADLSRCPMS